MWDNRLSGTLSEITGDRDQGNGVVGAVDTVSRQASLGVVSNGRKTTDLSVSYDVRDFAVLAETDRKGDVSVAWVVGIATGGIVRAHQHRCAEPELLTRPNRAPVSKVSLL